MDYSYPLTNFDSVCAENVVKTVPNNNIQINPGHNDSFASDIELNGTYNMYALQGSGVHGVRNILRCNRDGSQIDLWYEDDQTGRQQWKLTNQINSNTFNIEIQCGVTENRKYLSCNEDGTVLHLTDRDDNSGRQQWRLEKVAQTKNGEIIFNVCVARPIASNRRYLNAQKDGTVDLWYQDDFSGRQQWIFEKVQNNNIVEANKIYDINHNYQQVIPNQQSMMTGQQNGDYNVYAYPAMPPLQAQYMSQTPQMQQVPQSPQVQHAPQAFQAPQPLSDMNFSAMNADMIQPDYTYAADMYSATKKDASDAFIIPGAHGAEDKQFYKMPDIDADSKYYYEAKKFEKNKSKFKNIKNMFRRSSYADVGEMYSNDYAYGVNGDASQFVYPAKVFDPKKKRNFILFKV